MVARRNKSMAIVAVGTLGSLAIVAGVAYAIKKYVLDK